MARKFGLTIIKSAGNNHNQKNPPFFGDSNLALNIINVGSTNPNGTVLSIFSDYEKNPKFLFTKEAPKPLVVAPGESYYNIRTKTYHNGTSYSAPLVTGTVSILMKEFPQIRENPVAVMSVLAASSLDIYSTEINNNGLRYATGAGLLDYPMARIASRNVEVKLVENNLSPGTQLFESDCIILREGEQLIASCSSLFNGAYVDTRESQYL
nr:S8 family serine peptidase [uncultured Clostridium sp.]